MVVKASPAAGPAVSRAEKKPPQTAPSRKQNGRLNNFRKTGFIARSALSANPQMFQAFAENFAGLAVKSKMGGFPVNAKNNHQQHGHPAPRITITSSH
jgi:hypothetical protein